MYSQRGISFFFLLRNMILIELLDPGFDDERAYIRDKYDELFGHCKRLVKSFSR